MSDFDAYDSVDVKARYEGDRDCLINKVAKGFVYVDSNYSAQYGFFLKADLDSFFIIPNLKKYIAENKFRPNVPAYIGKRYKHLGNPKAQFNAGGGYVLSRYSKAGSVFFFTNGELFF